MKKSTLCGIICMIAILLCLGTVGVAYALYSIDANPLTIEITANVPQVSLDSLNLSYTGGNVRHSEALDTSAITAVANYSDGSEKALTASDISISGFSNTTLGTQTVTVSYTEGQATVSNTFSVKVVDNCRILGINGDWTLENGVSLSTNPTNVKEYMITGLKLTAKQSVKIWYNGKWYGYSNKKTGGASITNDTSDNLVMPIGTYDIYFDTTANVALWIAESTKTYTITFADSWATDANAIFYAWSWGSSLTADSWYQLIKNSNGSWTLTMPISANGCKVVRYNPAYASSIPSWDNAHIWGQTNNITISSSTTSIRVDFP